MRPDLPLPRRKWSTDYPVRFLVPSFTSSGLMSCSDRRGRGRIPWEPGPLLEEAVNVRTEILSAVWWLALAMCSVPLGCRAGPAAGGLAPTEEPPPCDGGAGAVKAAIPTYVVKRSVDAITIDGVASEQTWRRARRVGRFVRWDGAKLPDLTDCKMAWDDDALYIFFVCRDDDIQASHRRRDAALWEEDVVEAFIDADGDGKTYVELIVNPLNTVFDNYLLRNPLKKTGTKGVGEVHPQAMIVSWTCEGLTSAVTVDGTVRDPAGPTGRDVDRCWTVEMRVPFSSFVLTSAAMCEPPRDGDVWRIALTRYDRPDAGTFLHMAWSPPYQCGWPHETDRFGRAVFSAEPVSAP